MFANAAIFLTLVTAVTSAIAASPASSSAYVAPTILPDATEWNHEPFNVTAYLESAELGAQGRAKPMTKRGQKGVYICQNKNWGWPCWWQPAVGQCIHTNGWDFSLGPDDGVYCDKYEDSTTCSGNAQWANIQKPGYSAITAQSIKCETQWIW